jgi:hypothetical protein
VSDETPPPEFMSALVTEHFVLQGTSASTISEGGSRVSIYLSALSSGLVAIGFASGRPTGVGRTAPAQIYTAADLASSPAPDHLPLGHLMYYPHKYLP